MLRDLLEQSRADRDDINKVYLESSQLISKYLVTEDGSPVERLDESVSVDFQKILTQFGLKVAKKAGASARALGWAAGSVVHKATYGRDWIQLVLGFLAVTAGIAELYRGVRGTVPPDPERYPELYKDFVQLDKRVARLKSLADESDNLHRGLAATVRSTTRLGKLGVAVADERQARKAVYPRDRVARKAAIKDEKDKYGKELLNFGDPSFTRSTPPDRYRNLYVNIGDRERKEYTAVTDERGKAKQSIFLKNTQDPYGFQLYRDGLRRYFNATEETANDLEDYIASSTKLKNKLHDLEANGDSEGMISFLEDLVRDTKTVRVKKEIEKVRAVRDRANVDDVPSSSTDEHGVNPKQDNFVKNRMRRQKERDATKEIARLKKEQEDYNEKLRSDPDRYAALLKRRKDLGLDESISFKDLLRARKNRI